jgi:hypothetical protein
MRVAAFFGFCVVLVLGAAACSKSNASGGEGSASAASSPSASAPRPNAPPPAPITQGSILFIASGRFVPGEGERSKDALLYWTVRNNTKKKLISCSGFLYYYRSVTKKQIGRKAFDLPGLNLNPSQSKELKFGGYKTEEPKNTDYREVAFTKATFDDGTVFDDPSQAPEQRPYHGPIDILPP